MNPIPFIDQKIEEKTFLKRFFFFSLAPMLLWWIAMNVLEQNGYVIKPLRAYVIYLLIFVAIVARAFFPYKQIPMRGSSGDNRIYFYLFVLFGLLWPLGSVTYGFRQLTLDVKTISAEEINQQMPYVILKDVKLNRDMQLDQVIWKESTPRRPEQMEYRMLLPIAGPYDSNKRSWIYLSQWKLTDFEASGVSKASRDSLIQEFEVQGRAIAEKFRMDSVLYFSNDINRSQTEAWQLLESQTNAAAEDYLLIPSYTPIQQEVKWLIIILIGGYLIIVGALLLFMVSDDKR